MKLSIRCLVVAVVLSTSSLSASEEFVSPNKAFAVERKIKPEGASEQTILIVTMHPTRRLLSWRSTNRAVEVLWNTDSTFVAVNDYSANSGDFVYIIRVNKGSARLLRKPDSGALRKLIQAKYPDLQEFDRFSLSAERWEDSKLIMTCDGIARLVTNQAESFTFEASFDGSAGQHGTLVFGPLHVKRDA